MRLPSSLDEIQQYDLSGQVQYIDGLTVTSGGYGEIRIGAIDLNDRHTKVAVKTFRPYLQQSLVLPKLKSLFEREICVWSTLQHDNILPLLGFARDEGIIPSSISKFMKNGTVVKYAVDKTDSEIIRLILGIARGIKYLHDNGIIHSDLKSANVLVSEHGQPLICDFGLARIIYESTMQYFPEGPNGHASWTSHSSTESTNLRGTVRWMAPELLQPEPDGRYQAHSKSSDVWAFGMVICELLTQKVPYFEIQYRMRVVEAIIAGRLPSKPPESGKPLADALWQLCKDCWAKKADMRPSISDIIVTLEKLETSGSSSSLCSNHNLPSDNISGGVSSEDLTPSDTQIARPVNHQHSSEHATPEPSRSTNGQSLQTLRPILDGIKHLNLSGKILFGDDSTLIGVGGYGDIRTATYNITGCGNVKVAVKTLRVVFQQQPDVIKLFRDEIRIWSRLKHDNILQLLGFILEENGLPSLISEYMENGTVLKYVQHNPELDVAPLVLGMAEGLSYLHSKGVIHSDLKSDNVLISSSGKPLICDFGISRMISMSQSISGQHSQSAGNDTLKGSVRWMSPELLSISGNQPVKHTNESDIWAFGMTAYEIVTKRRPYYMLSDPQVIYSILRDQHPEKPDTSDWKEHNYELWEICTKCWFKDSKSRPTMKCIVTDLKGIIETVLRSPSTAPSSIHETDWHSSIDPPTNSTATEGTPLNPRNSPQKPSDKGAETSEQRPIPEAQPDTNEYVQAQQSVEKNGGRSKKEASSLRGKDESGHVRSPNNNLDGRTSNKTENMPKSGLGTDEPQKKWWKKPLSQKWWWDLLCCRC